MSGCVRVCMCVFSVCVRLVFTGSFQMIKQLYTIQSHTVTKYHHIYTLSAKVRQDVQALASLNRQHIFISRCSISAHTKTDNNKKKKKTQVTSVEQMQTGIESKTDGDGN